METTIPQLLTPRETAKILRTTYGCLAVWRCHRRKPLKFIRLGRKIFYTAEDIAAFINAQRNPGDGVRPAKFAKKRGRP